MQSSVMTTTASIIDLQYSSRTVVPQTAVLASGAILEDSYWSEAPALLTPCESDKSFQ